MEELLHQIEIEYGLALISLKAVFQEKGGRGVYLIQSHDQSFVLKVLSFEKTMESIERDTYIYSFMNDHEFHSVPHIIPTVNKTKYITFKDRFVYLMEYIEGDIPESNIANWSSLGVLVAQLHSIVDYPYATTFTFGAELPKLVQNAKQYAFKDEYLQLVDTLPNFDEMPQALIHSDIGLHNSIQRFNGTLIIVDWDDSGSGSRVLDIGYPLICQFITSELMFDAENARAFYRSYRQHVNLSSIEIETIFSAGLFFALMYLSFGNIDNNWKKIQCAIEHRSEIEKVFI